MGPRTHTKVRAAALARGQASFDGTERWVEHLLTYRRMGFTEVTLRITSRDQERQFDRLVGEVLPALEAAS